MKRYKGCPERKGNARNVAGGNQRTIVKAKCVTSGEKLEKLII